MFSIGYGLDFIVFKEMNWFLALFKGRLHAHELPLAKVCVERPGRKNGQFGCRTLKNFRDTLLAVLLPNPKL
jgi:hypothetical protein